MSDGSATRVSLAVKSPLLEVMDVSVFFPNKLDGMERNVSSLPLHYSSNFVCRSDFSSKDRLLREFFLKCTLECDLQ